MSDDASRVWAEDMSAAYDEHLVPAVFQPYADDLAARVTRYRPRVVLELAAGTGVLTRAMTASLPEVRITATDLNVAMVDIGSTKVPTATWRLADAMRLPFDDGFADLVACQFGVMFFPDRQAAYAEVARVLRPGGHFLFNCWGPLASHDVEMTVMAALAESFPADPPSFLARVPHGYHDADRITADLTAAGFRGVDVETVELDCTGTSAAHLARGYCRGTPLRAEIEARGDLEVTTGAVETVLERRLGSGSVVGRMAALVVSADAPSDRT
ncbi:MAG: methyltransferase protein [Frankiales bacterium]|nr:methyltransferase protein [Frankiales bacterium]